MRLTRRGRIVVNALLIAFVVFALAVAARFDAMDMCAKFVAYGDMQSAKDAGCPLDTP
jgi:hypothetical protein